MGMYIAILPDADRGMPRWGVSPSHGLDGQIGTGAPMSVAQPQARKRLGRAKAVSVRTAIPCPATPEVPRTPLDRQRERPKTASE